MAETVKNATVHNNKGDLFTSFNVADFDEVRGRDEVWRFVPVRRLRGLHNSTFSTFRDADITVDASAEVTVERIATTDNRVGRTGGMVDRVAAQAFSSVSEAVYVGFAANSVTTQPVTITITGAGVETTTFSHIVIEVETGAEATVDLRYLGSATHADNIEFIIGDNARLTVIVDASWNDDTVHISGQAAILGRDAVLRHNSAVFGGEIVRIVPRVRFTAPGGDAEMLGVYFADDGQFFEQRLLVDHAMPNCRSNVLYKGALQADPHSDKPEARTAWVGDVLIRSNAQGTDTYEANRNLVLTEGARADAVPNLEIETGEIAGAGHAATVGRFDDEQEFYLKSRGIPEAEARRLIVRGFFSEVIGRIPVESIREELENRIADELETLHTL
ncbi:ABC transporter involved in Fe-S cluster assembly permease protein [Corynebacterium kutscheri]|uniref:ABC transporter involved in Fe-S cluster assembly permease protein n=1 Tax=Corynebacterium kutscheri TaxID=35755 RepID=A0AB38VYI2_9CORY|nr:Fe-S cluster assembly protein SufD [Corynebacterium kutscheri]VEH08543.1 ABC transporter involved in Fe-S cluster assembly permease protein [Corynebacterium kutscheri]VEH79672.1 ABC transporter involved in Fe-S cluster assembly permease protein [Corynebacterium kutscheri]